MLVNLLTRTNTNITLTSAWIEIYLSDDWKVTNQNRTSQNMRGSK